ncbi:MAG: hypothetical protein WBA77_19945 [Microcoleaceae cyanobacterium]
MLGLRTHRRSVKTLNTVDSHQTSSSRRFPDSILKALRFFWQFSCFYGDYIAQPLESRQNLSISSQKSTD